MTIGVSTTKIFPTISDHVEISKHRLENLLTKALDLAEEEPIFHTEAIGNDAAENEGCRSGGGGSLAERGD